MQGASSSLETLEATILAAGSLAKEQIISSRRRSKIAWRRNGWMAKLIKSIDCGSRLVSAGWPWDVWCLVWIVVARGRWDVKNQGIRRIQLGFSTKNVNSDDYTDRSSILSV